MNWTSGLNTDRQMLYKSAFSCTTAGYRLRSDSMLTGDSSFTRCYYVRKLRTTSLRAHSPTAELSSPTIARHKSSRQVKASQVGILLSKDIVTRHKASTPSPHTSKGSWLPVDSNRPRAPCGGDVQDRSAERSFRWEMGRMTSFSKLFSNCRSLPISNGMWGIGRPGRRLSLSATEIVNGRTVFVDAETEIPLGTGHRKSGEHHT